MKLYTLGTSHGATEVGRACSCNLIEVNGSYYLFDCGGNVEVKMKNLDMPFQKIRAVFISHMHEDHAGTLTSIVKRFCHYNRTDDKVIIHMPEETGINAFKNWVDALHTNTSEGKVSYKLVTEGEIYSDENITVNAIRTKHIEFGKFPSYAYVVKTADKNFLYTGDLCGTFEDYPQIVFNEDFDAILCELVHFDIDKNLDTIVKSRTKKIIFTHMRTEKAEYIMGFADKFPFEICTATDEMCYEI